MTGYVSGLPDAAAPGPDPRGLARLMAIREHAEASLRALAPLTVWRFDGTERIAPDPAAVAERRVAADVARLVADVLSDAALCRAMARLLGRAP